MDNVATLRQYGRDAATDVLLFKPATTIRGAIAPTSTIT